MKNTDMDCDSFTPIGRARRTHRLRADKSMTLAPPLHLTPHAHADTLSNSSTSATQFTTHLEYTQTRTRGQHKVRRITWLTCRKPSRRQPPQPRPADRQRPQPERTRCNRRGRCSRNRDQTAWCHHTLTWCRSSRCTRSTTAGTSLWADPATGHMRGAGSRSQTCGQHSRTGC